MTAIGRCLALIFGLLCLDACGSQGADQSSCTPDFNIVCRDDTDCTCQTTCDRVCATCTRRCAIWGCATDKECSDRTKGKYPICRQAGLAGSGFTECVNFR